jgi:hypothetical protein
VKKILRIIISILLLIGFWLILGWIGEILSIQMDIIGILIDKFHLVYEIGRIMLSMGIVVLIGHKYRHRHDSEKLYNAVFKT